MKNNNSAHAWDVSPREAIEIQQKLRSSISLKPLDKKIKTIAGADVSLNMFGSDLYAGIIVLSYPDLREIDYGLVKMEAHFPYIPGLLSFREIPALLKAWERLKIRPDIIMVDGQGIAHPRRLGIASHFGVITNTPIIGAAKSVLTGSYIVPKTAGEHS